MHTVQPTAISQQKRGSCSGSLLRGIDGLVPPDDCDADYYDITDDAQGNRDFVKEQETPQCREDDLYVIKDGKLLCRCVSVSRSDGKLSHGCGKTGKYQYHPLSARHSDISRDHEWQREKAGEQRKAGDYDRGMSPFSACTSDKNICCTCPETAIQADQCRHQGHIGSGRPDNEQGTDKCDNGSHNVRSGRFFLQYGDGYQDSKEGRELVEHVSICQIQVVYGIEVGYQPCSSKQTSEEDVRSVFPGDRKAVTFYDQRYNRNDQCKGISEECFLHGRKLTRNSYKKSHERESHGSYYYTDYSFCLIFHGFLQMVSCSVF